MSTTPVPRKRGRPLENPADGVRVKATYKLPAPTIQKIKELAAERSESQSNIIVLAIHFYTKTQ